MNTPEHEARAALMRAADAGDRTMGRLVSRYGAAQTAEAIRCQRLPDDFEPAELDRPKDLGRRLGAWQARLAAADPPADLAAGRQAGARLVIPGDAEWPTQLDQLGPGRPLGLWLHGDADLRFSCLRSAAIVGARAATPYGAHVAAQFGIGLSESGWTVISGGAIGIDGAAHRGALAAGSPTVVVLACGVDIPYPAAHQPLFAAARDQGVLVSECPPGVHPTRARFLIRNRLIAALSRGTAVIEAALRSGALNTAAHALALDRHLAAVPGPVTSAQSAGCHRLLREEKAVCVTSPEELIELVGTMGDDLAPPVRPPALPRDALSPQTRAVLDAVAARGGAGPASIAVAAGVSLNTALSALGSLAAAGYVERVPKGWRIRKAPSPVYRKAPDSVSLPPSLPAPTVAHAEPPAASHEVADASSAPSLGSSGQPVVSSGAPFASSGSSASSDALPVAPPEPPHAPSGRSVASSALSAASATFSALSGDSASFEPFPASSPEALEGSSASMAQGPPPLPMRDSPSGGAPSVPSPTSATPPSSEEPSAPLLDPLEPPPRDHVSPTPAEPGSPAGWTIPAPRMEPP
ncbi:DNA-processing protein DprA [Nonomuraea sp. SBT364]|uniref:DNA-processing protein DprA n=1 Tax=Nonomuraea sp. SBT364 TaxID=1580530 RepID=UPI0009E68F31